MFFRLTISILVFSSCTVNAQTKKEIYDLQERCGKSAAEMFDKDFPKDDRKGLETFENNYNARLNKCFLLEQNTMITRDQGNTYFNKFLTLIDVNANKAYGTFDPLGCEVQGQKCKTEEEFKKLIRPFMED